MTSLDLQGHDLDFDFDDQPFVTSRKTSLFAIF